MSATPELPFISVIIPTRNEEAYIANCLDSLKALDYPADRFEVIIADGHSTDRTREIAESYGAIVLIDETKMVSHGRHVGFEHSRGDLIAFSDADCIMEPRWLRNALKYFDDAGVGGVTGPTLLPPDETPFGRGAGFIFSLAVGIRASCHADTVSKVVEVDDLPGANCIYRREVIEQVMPLATMLITEDVEMNWRIRKNGWKLLRTPDVQLWHYKRPTPKRLARQLYRYGMGRCQCAKISCRMLAPAHALLSAWIPLAAVAVPLLAIFAPVVLAVIGGLWTMTVLGLVVAAWARTGSPRAAFGALLAMGIVIVLWPLGFLREFFFPIRRLEESSLRSTGTE